MTKFSARSKTLEHLLGGARARLLNELCGRPQTAVDLAGRVGTSSNAVRVHLEAMRAGGLVDYEVVRRGVGKPTHVYTLTPFAEYLLSTAYPPVLQGLLDTLRDKLDDDFTPVLRETGLSLAERVREAKSTSTRRGIDAAAEILAGFGAPTTVKSDGKDRVLSNESCPLAAISRETPEICVLMESLLSSASDTRLKERCERGDHPRCQFVEARPSR